MSWIGDFRLGDTFDTKFVTVQTTGAPFTLAGSPVVSAYVGNNTTELTAGITLSVDFDGRTGLNNIRVVASGGNGYATASNYQLVITAGTVNSVSVAGYVVGEFSIENRSALMPTTAARTLVVDAAGLADANVVKLGPTGSGTAQTARDVGASVLLSAGAGTGQLDFTSGVVKANVTQFNGSNATSASGRPEVNPTHWNGTAVSAPATAGIPEVNVKNINNVSAAAVTTVKAVQGLTTADTVTTVSGNVNGSVASVTGNVGGNVVGSVASVTGNVGGNVVGSVASVTAAVAITSNIKKNQALAAFEFLMTDSTNHNPSTGLAVTVTRSIDGGAFGAGTLSAVTEIASGIYAVDFGAGDLNGKVIVLKATAAASDTRFERIVTQP